MNFRSLLVVLDADARCDARTALAARFAASHDAHLIGIAATGVVELPAAIATASRQLDEAAATREAALQLAEQQVERFLARCRSLEAESVEAHVHEGDRLAVVLHHAHCADLVVVGQADPHGGTHREQDRFVEQLVLANARPTLIVPHAGHFDTIDNKVLIAWDDSHGCARAVADALPLLRHARQVHLVSCRREGEGNDQLVHDRLGTVRRWLMWQGVSATVEVVTTAAPVGEAIHRQALDRNADLVVMGAYGHSRWTQRLLGGATRTALSRSPVPLLVSH
jgi:nucleotide-binding universal stress UspA family protein